MIFFSIKKRRVLASFLAVLLVAMLFPISAFAAEPLTLLRAEVTADGGVGLTFSKELSTADLTNKVKEGFAVTGLGGPITITNASLHSVSGGHYNFVQLYLNPVICGGEAAALSYTPGNIQAADGGVLEEIASMDINNNLSHPTLGADAPNVATVGTAYSHTFIATGGTAPYVFSLDSDSLPSGLVMDQNGAVTGTPSQEGVFQFSILVKDAKNALDLRQFSITVQAAPVTVCEIAGTGYTSFASALAAIPAGGTATIRLLCNVDYNAGVFLDGKKVTFDLNGYTLNINNPEMGGFGLAVQQGGAVHLSGSGALNATGETYGVRVSTNALSTQAMVTSATATGPTGEAAYAAGTNASLTVLGNVTATGISAIGAHTISNAVIDIRGSVFASNQGVCASSSTIKVAGDVQANGLNLLNEPSGIGVNVYAGTSEIAGSVRANRIGVMMRANGTATVDGTIAAPGYIQFADDAPVEINNFLAQTTKTGYRTYQAPTGTVWVKGESIPTEYTITIQNDGNGTASANYQSAAEGAEITLSATPNTNYRFKEWRVIGGGISIVKNKFYILDQDVTIQAIFEFIPPTAFSVTINGSYAQPTGAGSYVSGTTVNIYAGSRSDYSFTGWTSTDVTITDASSKNASFMMAGKAVTVTANWSYNGDNSNGSGSTESEAVYTISSGAGGKWGHSSAGLSFTCNGSYSCFSGIWVDGNTISSANYSVQSGSTVLTLKPAYLCTLSEGSHILRMIYSNGYSQTTFIVSKTGYSNPQTGMEFNFGDVKESDWFYEDAAYVFENGLMNGTSDTTFSPKSATTRGMIAMILYRLEGCPAVTDSTSFDDVRANSYYDDAIAWAAGKNIVAGYGNGKFGPNDSITREQMAAILYRYAAHKGYNITAATHLSMFRDADKISGYAATALAWATAKGLISGKGNGILDPDGEATRAQSAAILHRFSENIIK